MKKLFVLAITAILAANISAQEVKAQKAECKKEKKEFKISREQRIERDIQFLTDELYLSDAQAAKFAEKYREFMNAKAQLYKEFRVKFAEDLNERQVEAVLHFHGPKHKGECKGECKGEHQGGKPVKGDKKQKKAA